MPGGQFRRGFGETLAKARACIRREARPPLAAMTAPERLAPKACGP